MWCEAAGGFKKGHGIRFKSCAGYHDTCIRMAEIKTELLIPSGGRNAGCLQLSYTAGGMQSGRASWQKSSVISHKDKQR